MKNVIGVTAFAVFFFLFGAVEAQESPVMQKESIVRRVIHDTRLVATAYRANDGIVVAEQSETPSWETLVRQSSGGKCSSRFSAFWNRETCNLVKQLRDTDYFGISADEATDDELYEYVKLNRRAIEADIARLDFGRELHRFVNGDTNTFSGQEKTFFKALGKAGNISEYAASIIQGLKAALPGSTVLTVSSAALGALTPIIEGIGVYKKGLGVVTGQTTRALLYGYFQQREKDGAEPAWRELDYTFGDSLSRISKRTNIPEHRLDEWFENAFMSYRLVSTSFPDAKDIRREQGKVMAGIARQQSVEDPPTKDKERETSSLAYRVEQQLRKCWVLPKELSKRHQYRFLYEIEIRPDYKVIEGKPVETRSDYIVISGKPVEWARLKNQPKFDEISSAAFNAATNDLCRPLKLTSAEYQNLDEGNISGRLLKIWFDTKNAGTTPEKFECAKRSLDDIKRAPSECEIIGWLIRDKALTSQCVYDLGGPDNAIFISERVDLNRDGVKEVFVNGTGGCACGARRCYTWAYGYRSNRFRMIADFGPTEDIQTLKTYTNGYIDLQWSAPAGSDLCFVTLKFDGKRYKEIKSTWSCHTVR